jgi:eukaryotic-like serine/threonine-protein kinase
VTLEGTTVAGRYDVLELLGQGGMGAVYRVFDRELEEVVALKVIRQELASTRAIVDRFRTEVKLARRVTHANIARTFELGHTDDMVFCTMEHVAGESLARMLARRGALPVAEAVAIVSALCDGLAAAHAAGVIHRDIKPDNVLLANGRTVLTDFGVAAVVAAEGEVAGTPAYMAPEQALGRPATPAADVYAVGVLLYEMIAGARAFTGAVEAIFFAKQERPYLAVAGRDVPVALADAIAAATAREPGARIASAAALKQALSPFHDTVAPASAAPVAITVAGAPQVPTVVILAPRGRDDRLYLAEAVHAELLHRLSRVPRLRTLPRETGVPAALRVELDADDELGVTAAGSDGRAFSLRLPLAVGHVSTTAESLAAAIVAAIAPRSRPDRAGELLLRANHVARGEFARFASAVPLLEEAAQLAPDDPAIAASLALALIQRAFFWGPGGDQLLGRAKHLVRVALATGPQLCEAHLAAGQLELHLGEAATAAGHFRVAIACAPYATMAHEQLGRMLLEAGHLDAGLSRLEEALSLAPHLRSADWQIARARALEGEWEDYERLVAADTEGNLVARLRFVCWRRDVPAALELRELFRAREPGAFAQPLFDGVLAVMCEGAWREHREIMRAQAALADRPSKRSNAFLAQLVAEAAAISGDDDVAAEAIGHATIHGLFDKHWLDRCPVLAGVRARRDFEELRAPVARRADAVLDALYGDHPVQAPARTQAATPQWLDETTLMR